MSALLALAVMAPLSASAAISQLKVEYTETPEDWRVWSEQKRLPHFIRAYASYVTYDYFYEGNESQINSHIGGTGNWKFALDSGGLRRLRGNVSI